MAMSRFLGASSLTTTPPMAISPAVIVLQSGDHAQQRALAAAGRPDQHQEFVVGDGQVDAVDDFHRAEALDHLTKIDFGQPPLLEPLDVPSQMQQCGAFYVTAYKVPALFARVEASRSMDGDPSPQAPAASGAGRRSAGIRDVASLAGVSTATVSRFFNEPSSLRPDMRMRVDNAVRELGYIRHGAARALSMRRSHAIGAIIPTVDNATRANKVTALQKRCRERGYNLVLALSEYDLDLELQQCRNLIEAGIDGIMLEGGLHDPALYTLLEKRGIAFVNTSVYDPLSPYPNIGFDNRATASRLAEHLLDLGHRSSA